MLGGYGKNTQDFRLAIGVDSATLVAIPTYGSTRARVSDPGRYTRRIFLTTTAAPESPRPSALDHFAEFFERLGGHRLVVCLDFDGTLAEIVPRPELATMSDRMRSALGQVARRFSTAILSGRSLDDVRDRIGIEGLVYAGNHGLEIEGPPASGICRRLGSEFRDAIRQSAGQLRETLSDIDGLLVEDKGYSLSVHYRLVDPAEFARVEATVDRIVDAFPDLEKRSGKMVFELRPRIEWDKGRALSWVLEAIDDHDADILPLYIGDDVTDEDAFDAIADRGIGILVSDRPRSTAAKFQLRDPGEVCRFLERVAELGDV